MVSRLRMVFALVIACMLASATRSHDSRRQKSSFWAEHGVTGGALHDDALLEPYSAGFLIEKIALGSDAEKWRLAEGDVLLVGPESRKPTAEDHIEILQKLRSRGFRQPRVIFMQDGKLFITSQVSSLPKN